jgi:DNA transposition AAA+ family ATPase
MTEEKIINEELYQKFFSIVGSPDEGKKVSQARIAKELGLSSAVISSYKNRNYNGNIAAVEEKIKAFLEREERRLIQFAVPVVQTITIENVCQAVEMAHDYKDIAVIIGESGFGKTTAVNQYAEYNPGAVFVMRAYKSIIQQKTVAGIAKAIGISSIGSKSVLVDNIIDALKGRDAVLIIDEADYLSDASLELLRCIIVDAAEVGLVLVGLPRLAKRITTISNDHSQILTRVGTFLNINGMNTQDSEKIIQNVYRKRTVRWLLCLSRLRMAVCGR